MGVFAGDTLGTVQTETNTVEVRPEEVQKIVKKFCLEAQAGVPLTIVDIMTGTFSEGSLRMDKTLSKLTVTCKTGTCIQFPVQQVRGVFKDPYFSTRCPRISSLEAFC